MEKRIMSGSLQRPSRISRAGKPTAALFALLLSGSLAGCVQSGPRFDAPFMLADPSENHPILVSKTVVALNLQVRSNSYGLTGRQVAELYEFLRGYNQDQGEKLVIRAPSGGANERAVMHAFADLRELLKRHGFTRDMVELEPYYASSETSAPIRLSYLRYVAKGPDCPDWSENISRDPQNMPYPDLGCATQRNLAAQVADPRDLLEPRAETPRSSDRRDTVWKKYIAGDPTGATRSEDEKAVVDTDVESNQ
jgi:pilus assembly protein CpaD